MEIYQSSPLIKSLYPVCEKISKKARLIQHVLKFYNHEIKEENTDEALSSLIKLLALARISSSEDPLVISQSHLLVAIVYMTRKEYWKQGELHAGEAVLHAENSPTSKDQLNILLESYYLLGYSKLKLGKPGEALESATAARSCISDLHYLSYLTEDSDLEYKVCLLQGWTSPSRLQFLEEALTLPGPQHKNVYIQLMISECQREKGDTSAALKSAQTALDLTGASGDVAMQADATRSLGDRYLEASGHGCADQGISLLHKAVALYTAAFSGLDTNSLSTVDSLVAALAKLERYDEAIGELKAVKEAKILKHGEYSKPLADFHKNLGSLYLIEDKTTEALRHFKASLTILHVIQTKPNSITTSIKNTIQSLEANKSVKPMFKLY